MTGNFKILLKQTAETTNQIWLHGWAEANAGNISIRLDKSLLPTKIKSISFKMSPYRS